MQYELYVDSLFLINFSMNLYLLILVNRSTLRTAAPVRLFGGAVWGSFWFLLLFAAFLPAVGRAICGISIGTAGMLLITFPVADVRMFLKLLEKLFLFSFCMGGLFLFLIRLIPSAAQWMTGVWGILAVGGIAFLFLKKLLCKREQQESLCRATLRKGGASMTVSALIDSGNSLVEPVSGKPVSVVEEKVFSGLWQNSMQGFRVIPYHSVGKEHGIMNGYLLPELCLDVGGVKKEFRDVYIAVSPEGIKSGREAAGEHVKMIINPMLLAEDGKGKPCRRQKVRNNDFESGNTGKNAV